MLNTESFNAFFKTNLHNSIFFICIFNTHNIAGTKMFMLHPLFNFETMHITFR